MAEKFEKGVFTGRKGFVKPGSWDTLFLAVTLALPMGPVNCIL